MEPDILTETYIYPFPKATHFSIKLSSSFQFDKISKDVLLVIDKSGSMSGSPIDTTKEMVNLLLSQIIGPSTSSFSLITYNDNAVVSYNMNQNVEELKSTISKIHASGGTCFTKVLNAVQSLIKLYPKAPFLSIIFLTDGQIESSMDIEKNHKNLNKALNQLGDCIKERTKSCEIHALGVRADHDPFFLTGLIKLGTAQGTYQYLKHKEDITESFNNIIEILDSKGFNAFLTDPTLFPTPYKVDFIKVSDKTYEAEGFLDYEGDFFKEKKELTLTIQSESFKTAVTLKPRRLR